MASADSNKFQMPVGGVEATVEQKNGSLIDISLPQKSAAHEAAFHVIAREAADRFGKRATPKIGQGWKGDHHVAIRLGELSSESGEALPPVSINDIRSMMEALNEQYPTAPDVEKAARVINPSARGRG